MAAVLGMRGSGSFVAGGTYAERPENWREEILRLYPNGHAPLTAILSMLGKEVTDDPIFHWFQQELPDFRVHVNNGAGYGAGDTILVVDDGAGTAGEANKCVRGTVIMVERTREIMWVAQDPALNTTITVQRGMGEVAAAPLVNNDVLFCFTSAYQQGASVPTSISFDPTPCFGYAQIMRKSLSETRTGMRTRLRTGDSYEKAKMECLDMISLDMEQAFIWGQLYAGIEGGQLKLTTRGFYQWMIGDAACNCDGTNVFESEDCYMSKAQFETWLQGLMSYGSTNKLLLCGSGLIHVLNQLYEGAVTVNAVSGDQSYGLDLKEWISPHGRIYIKTHPLMNRHPVYTYDAMALDLDFMNYRYVDDLEFIPDRQDPGVDGRVDEFLVECGLEMHHCKAHGLIQNVKYSGEAPEN